MAKELKNLFYNMYNYMVDFVAGDSDSECVGEEQNDRKRKSAKASLRQRSRKPTKSDINTCVSTPVVQYNLKSRTAVPTSLRDRFKIFIGYKSFDNSASWSERFINSYFSWTFRVSFAFLLLSGVAVFYALTHFYAALFYAFASFHPECVDPKIVKGKNAFSDLFALSWATFSTVGYGNIHPSLASAVNYTHKCFFFNFLASTEAFIGILYSAFCSSVLFAKILRAQNQAQVVFSDLVTLQYGSALQGEYVELSQKTSRAETIPCPTLEFQIANRLHDSNDGAILDATLKCMVVSLSTDLRNVSAKGKRQSEISPSILETSDPERPYFKYVWKTKHELNENSPLLTTQAKRLIRKNRGFWPPSLNTYEKIRSSIIQFEHIIINLSGMSNSSASTVSNSSFHHVIALYSCFVTSFMEVIAQKIYNGIDIYIGYDFVNILYKDTKTGRWKIDLDVINDAIEQDGGGGEPLVDELRRES